MYRWEINQKPHMEWDVLMRHKNQELERLSDIYKKNLTNAGRVSLDETQDCFHAPSAFFGTAALTSVMPIAELEYCCHKRHGKPGQNADCAYSNPATL